MAHYLVVHTPSEREVEPVRPPTRLRELAEASTTTGRSPRWLRAWSPDLHDDRIFSLWDADGSSRFHDASAADHLSGEAVAFLAGVLDHLPGLCGLTAPSFNSYRRIVPQYWAGAYACWGHDNREAPIRVPSVFRGHEEASTNAELKAADATCNPYLALGGLIAAGLDGIERGLALPEPVEVDPATLSEREREERGIRRVPESQAEAIDALVADDVLIAALGPTLAESYLAVRRSEWTAYSGEDEAFEQQGHFSKY